MSLTGKYDWYVPQRQATAGLLIILYKTIIRILKSVWPFILLLLFRQGKKGPDYVEIFIIVLSLVILIRSVVEFFYFRFYMAGDELIIKKGFISKKNIAIPLEKIQAVHIEQTLLHQLLEVVKVRIDTAGTEKTEAVIDAIDVRKAEQLKTYLLHEQRQLSGDMPVATMPPEIPVIQLKAIDIIKLGLSANHIQAFFIVLAALFSLLQNLREAFGDRVIQTVEESSLTRSLLASIPLLIVLVLLISVMVSMVTILLKYFDFTLSETPLAYKLKSGLINTRQFLVPFKRIQFVSWEANWLRRKIGLYNVEFHQVSGRRVTEKQRVRVPVTRASFIEPLFAHYHPLVEQTPHSTHRIHRAYPVRIMLLTAILPVLIILPFTQIPGWNAWWLLLLLLIPYRFFSAFFYRKNFRLFITPEAFQVNSGIFGREVRVVKWYKIQHIRLRQSIYQRRKNLATLKLYTAGGYVTIPFISLELAREIQNYALYEVERSPRPWI